MNKEVIAGYRKIDTKTISFPNKEAVVQFSRNRENEKLWSVEINAGGSSVVLGLWRGDKPAKANIIKMAKQEHQELKKIEDNLGCPGFLLFNRLKELVAW